jgi:GDP-L-fucose synthase
MHSAEICSNHYNAAHLLIERDGYIEKTLSILNLAEMVTDVVGYKGPIGTDPTKPDGTPRKFLDVSRLSALGWQAQTDLWTGIEQTYRWYLANY